jgi:hypothetical protein
MEVTMKSNFMLVILLSVLSISSLYSQKQVNYNAFDSIEEVIEFESNFIEYIPNDSSMELSEAYANRGESFLLCNRFAEALDDFQKSYDFAIIVKNAKILSQLIFRSLFGQAIAYANLNMPQAIEPITHELLLITRSMQCNDCGGQEESKAIPCAINAFSNRFSIITCASNSDVQIYGPDEISIEDCIDMVNNTANLSKILISKAPSTARAVLTVCIDRLAGEARKCCRAGGLWKACFQPLANKYHQWNQKWKVFGIPPDPAWD